MIAIVAGTPFSVKDKLCKHLRRCRQADVRVRYRLVSNWLNPIVPRRIRSRAFGWLLHGNVTRTPTCPNIAARMREVRYYLRKRHRSTIKMNHSPAVPLRPAA
jgi:hypothetical protein